VPSGAKGGSKEVGWGEREERRCGGRKQLASKKTGLPGVILRGKSRVRMRGS